MKRWAATAIMILCTATCAAQNIAIGEKVPKAKLRTWLNNRMPQKGKLTYIEFFHYRSRPCIETLSQLNAVTAQSAGELQVVIITRENLATAAPVLAQYVDEATFVAVDANMHMFEDFGVRYVPFGIIVDGRRRALWFGNPAEEDMTQLLEKIKNR